MESNSLYSSPSVLYALGIVVLIGFCGILWRMTDRDYTKNAENYWNTRKFLSNSYYGGRKEINYLDNIVVIKTE